MSFTCPRCGSVSHHPTDQGEGYCGRCHQWTGALRSEPDPLPLATVTLQVCQRCLLGVGGECHTPGCTFWMRQAPNVPLGLVFPIGGEQ